MSYSATPPRPSTSSSVCNPLSRSVGSSSLNTPTTARDSRSPSALSPSRAQIERNPSLSPNGYLPQRSPSSMSQNSRSSTPTLRRKASMNSVQGVGGITPLRASPSRRTSSQYPTMAGKSPLSEQGDPIPSPPRHTARSIARNHFAAELEAHKIADGSKAADTVVILHDSCYGHRYARMGTSASDLKTIVERPERINACILGLSAAYVRLGDRHADGQYPPDPRSDSSEIPNIPFKIHKSARYLPLSSPAVTNVHGIGWMRELEMMCNNAESRLAGNGKELTRPDMHRSSSEKPAEFHIGDLYLCPESLSAMSGALGAVCEGVDQVFEGSASGNGPFRTFVLVRPPGHHCSADYPSGFCWVNNVHVGIQHAVVTHGLTHAAIIDFDLHHGDGSQAITWESNARAAAATNKKADQWKKVSIGYFSCHDIDSYPCEMADVEKVTNASVCIEGSHNQTVWNVHLKRWKSEAEFWELYETKYSVLLEKTRNYLRAQTDRLRSLPKGPKPKGAIFLSAGFDASEWETNTMQRHPVNVPTEFYARLTRDVVGLAAEEGCAVDGRVISVLEGGYSDRALSTGVLSHLSGLAAGDAITIKKEPSPNGLAYEMVQKIGVYDGHMKRESITLGNSTYNPAWWSVQNLEQLDAVVKSIPIEEVRTRETTPPTYASPTQSFINKVNFTSRRTSFAMSVPPTGYSRSPSRADTPLPEVDWSVATHELSKLLIPSDRSTLSHRSQDLAVPKVKREKQPVVNNSDGDIVKSMERMTLRKPRPATKLEMNEDRDLPKPASRASRRRTDIGMVSLIQDMNEAPPMPVSTFSKSAASKRRASIASTGSVASEAPSVRGSRKSQTNGIPPVPSTPVTSQAVRPSTSQSIRPESSASMRSSIPPPAVASRARKPAQPRKKSPLTDNNAGIDSLASDLARVAISNKDANVELVKTKKPVVARARKAAKPAEAVISEAVPKRKIMIDLKKLEERANGARKSDPVALAPSPMFTTPVNGSKTEEKDEATSTTPVEGVSKEAPVEEVIEAVPIEQISTEENPGQENISLSVRAEEKTQIAPEAPQYASLPPPSNSPSTPSPRMAENRLLSQAVRIPLPASAPPTPQSISTLQPSSTSSNGFIPYKPDGPTPHSIEQQEPLQWLEPNTATPSPLKKRELPVFTSTGAIPFGVPKLDKEQVKKEEGKGDIWEVPESPYAK